ncbi:MAG: PEGA domain-containing protein [Myxococcales bacterium]|nr:PEGA domain-containing protein [Myxococcales bacterium]
MVRRRTVVVLTVLFCTVLVSVIGWADEKKPIILIPIAFDDKPNAQIYYYLDRALDKRPELQNNDVNSALDRGTNRIHFDNLKQARVHLDAARAAFKQANYPQALVEFTKSVELYEKSFSFLQSDQEFIDALVGLGFSNGMSGVQDEAINAFKKALTFNPDAKYDFSRYPQNLHNLFKKAKKDLATASTGDLKVITEPSNAEVYVNGQFRGISPVVVRQLPIGAHYVKIRKLGFSRINQTMVVSAGTNTQTVVLTASRRKSLLDSKIPTFRLDVSEKKASDTIVDLRSLFFVDHVIFASVFGAGDQRQLQLSIFDLDRRSRLKQVKIPVNVKTFGLAAATSAIKKLLDGVALTLAPEKRPTHKVKTRVVKSTPLYKKWWFWTVIGVAVAGGAATGIILGTRKSGGESGLKKVPNTGAMILHF